MSDKGPEIASSYALNDHHRGPSVTFNESANLFYNKSEKSKIYNPVSIHDGLQSVRDCYYSYRRIKVMSEGGLYHCICFMIYQNVGKAPLSDKKGCPPMADVAKRSKGIVVILK